MSVFALSMAANRSNQVRLNGDIEQVNIKDLDTSDFWSVRMVLDYFAGLIGDIKLNAQFYTQENSVGLASASVVCLSNNNKKYQEKFTEPMRDQLNTLTILMTFNIGILFYKFCLGVAGVLVGHPLDTVKVHLQTDDPKNPKYRGTFHCLRTILYKDKLFGLYRGISSPMAGIGMVNAIVFGVYGNVQRFRDDPSALSTHCIAGATAGFIQSIVCAPMELAKTRLQLENHIDSGIKFKGPLDCLKYIIRTEGIRAGFKGLTATAARDIPGFAGYFVSYEYLMKQRERPSALYTLLAGGLAGQFSWLICYPVDVVKTTMQADGLGKKAKYKSFIDCSVKGYQREGTRFFFRGLTSTLIRAFPMNAVCFLVVSCILEFADSHKFDMLVHTNNKPFNVITMENSTYNIVHLKEPNDEELVRKMVVPNVHTLSEPPGEILYRWESDDKRNNVVVEDKYYLYENDRIIRYGDYKNPK